MRRAIAQWEGLNLTVLRRYQGQELQSYGFPYGGGEYVPITASYSALCQWLWATRIKQMAGK